MALFPARSATALALSLMLGAPLAAQDAATTPTPDTAIATVNGEIITLADLVSVRADLPQQYQSLPDEALYDGIRQQLVDQKLLEQEAEKTGLAGDPAIARALALQHQSLLANFYLRRKLNEGLTDAAVEAAYKERYADVPPVQEVRASHILVPTEEEAKKLHDELSAGADFAALAAEHGTDGTKTNGGDLGFFTRETMVPEFADAAFALEAGQLSAPVQSQFGWHLIKVTDKRDKPAPAIDEVRDEIKGALASEIAQKVLADLRTGATVDQPEDRPGLSALRDDSLVDHP